MQRVLERFSDGEVIEFGTQFTNHVCRLNHWRLWGAGVTIFPDISGDSFHYFRSWIVGKGREVFEIALLDPDALAPYIDDPEVENEGLEYVAEDVLRARGVGVYPRDFAEDADASPEGEPYDESRLNDEYPRLIGRFG